MKQLICSAHALERMQEREMSRFQMESTIRNPDWVRPAKRGRMKAKKHFNSRCLNVFYKETKSIIILVTAYWSLR